MNKIPEKQYLGALLFGITTFVEFLQYYHTLTVRIGSNDSADGVV